MMGEKRIIFKRNKLPKNGDVGYNGPLGTDVPPTVVIFCCWMVVAGFCFGFWNGENAVATKVKEKKYGIR